MRVLWIDDDAPLRPHRLLECDVFPAQDLSTAQSLLDAEGFDAVILDILIPQAGWGDDFQPRPGMDFLQALRKRHGGSLSLAVYTSVDDPEIEEAASRAGARVFLKHVTGLRDLLAWIRQSHARRSAAR